MTISPKPCPTCKVDILEFNKLKANKENERQHRRVAVNNYEMEVRKNIELSSENYKLKMIICDLEKKLIDEKKS
jgi:hypothetical protein